MKDKIYYYDRNGTLQLTLNEYPYYSEPRDLFDWTWGFNEQFGKINTFRRAKGTYDLVIGIAGEYSSRHNALCDIFNADVLANEPGYLLINGWKLPCYIIEAENTVVFDLSRQSKFTVRAINSTWIRENTKSYNGAPGGGSLGEDLGRDYIFSYIPSEKYSDSGEIIKIENDEEDLTLTSLTTDLEPIQDLNGYDKPWVGGAGANKWDEEWELGALSATGENATSSTEIRSKKYIPVVGGQTYYLCCAVASTFNYKFYDADKNFISGAYIGRNNTLLIPNDARYMRFFMGTAYGTTYNHDIAINYPSSVTTYSPYSNICPISGHTEVDTTRAGKNLLDTSYGYDSGTMQGVTFTVNSDKSITVNGTATATAYFNLTFKGAFGTSKPMPQLAGKTVTVKCKNALANPRVNIDYFKADGTNYGGTICSLANDNAVTRTLPSDFYSFRAFIAVSAGATVDNITLYPQIELGTEVAEYEPYKGNTYTTALGRTVYGGTLDVVSGVLTVDKAILTLNTANMNNSEMYAGWKASGVKALVGAGINRAYSDVLLNVGTTYFINTNGSNDLLMLPQNQYGKTQSEWIALAIDVQVCIYLATPQTYQLTAQQISLLTGDNYLWASTGGVIDVAYETISVPVPARGYNYGYSQPESHYASIDLAGTNNGFEAVIYGPQVNPVIYLNNQPVQVNVELTATQRLRIVSNGSIKTIEILEANGTSTDAFVYRDKENTPFLTLGQHTDLTFGQVRFDFTTIERRSQPTWN